MVRKRISKVAFDARCLSMNAGLPRLRTYACAEGPVWPRHTDFSAECDVRGKVSQRCDPCCMHFRRVQHISSGTLHMVGGRRSHSVPALQTARSSPVCECSPVRTCPWPCEPGTLPANLRRMRHPLPRPPHHTQPISTADKVPNRQGRRRGAPHAGPVRLWPVAGCELQCLRLECQHFTAERCPRRLPPAATAPLCSGPVHTPRCKRPSCTPLLGSPSAPRAGRTAQLSYGKSAAKGRSARQQRCHAGAYLGGARDRRYNKTFIPHYRVCLR